MATTVTYPFYLGGMASCIAASCTHPLDLLKVRLQVMEKATAGGAKPNFLSAGKMVVTTEGIGGLYKGLTASLLRQVMYSTTRFATYDIFKEMFESGDGAPLPFYKKVASAALAGSIGGFAGCPADVTNVRMQADGLKPPAERRGYKNAIDGMIKIAKEGGVRSLFKGGSPTVARGGLVTVGQLAFYDQFKQMLESLLHMKDGMVLHASASTLAGGVATLLTMPMDVVKTRMMNSYPGQYKGLGDCLIQTVKVNGVAGLFKGFVPAFIRLGPHTVLTFLSLEQLRAIYRKINQ
eukprot:comp23354_c0_seq1/m.38569 comp23354_c0_seq1/g.38569  ORF comp23354_c0_seq1/g.38569 comp23354_c0_seq1/m.38569 type:complete len:293 (-) comp23354_c0_seq1:461-1339(-)